MKHGRKPTKVQKIAIKRVGMNADNWLIVKNLPQELHLVHRLTGTKRVIPIERR